MENRPGKFKRCAQKITTNNEIMMITKDLLNSELIIQPQKWRYRSWLSTWHIQRLHKVAKLTKNYCRTVSFE